MRTASPSVDPTGAASRKLRLIGVAVVAIAVIWQGVGTAVVSHSVPASLGPFATFVAFAAAAGIAVASAALRCKQRGPASHVQQPLSRREFVSLNLVTAGAFACFYIGATLIPATAASVIETGIGPLAVALALSRSTPGRKRDLVHPLVLLGTAAAAAIAVFVAESFDPVRIVSGIALSITAGTCAAGIILLSRKLAARNTSALAVSAARFHLTWLICGPLALPALLVQPPNAGLLIHVSAVAVASISLPILILQFGISVAAPQHSALLICALPAIVLLTDVALGAPLTPVILATICALIGVLLLGLRQQRTGHHPHSKGAPR